MAEVSPALLESLQILHSQLVSAQSRPKEQRNDLFAVADLLAGLSDNLKSLLDIPARSKQSRDAVNSDKITIPGDDDYAVNEQFREIVLQVADHIDLDEIEAARLVVQSETDERVLGRQRRDCALIRFHQQRQYLLNCIRLLIEISSGEDTPEEIQEWLGPFLNQVVFPKLVPRCMAAMRDIKAWLQRIIDQVNSATVLGQAGFVEVRESIEFSRVSLIQQHEVLSVILCQAIEQRHASSQDFTDFLAALKKVDKYDYATVHLLPPLGAFISVFGSTEGNGDLEMARKLNAIVCQQSDDDSRFVPYLHAAVRAWWLAEYSGWYLDDAAGSMLQGVDIDAEDTQRSKLFVESLKDGAFDMMLAVAADVKPTDWQDPARAGIRQWLQRKTPALPPDTVPFSDFFQTCVAAHLEVFVDAFISNLPDILRKLRTEEDEQRQLNHAHEQDLDLERFLLIIAFTYEGRPSAADTFWADPDSNLYGFLLWSSRRASTPLVSAFCEMLQSLSEDDRCATSAHNFLLDDAHHASGKIRKTLSLTWAQIMKELEYFSNKIGEKPSPPPTHAYKPGKYTNEQVETEPESAMMLECYLRLITKLATHSDTARTFLLDHQRPVLVDVIFQLISSNVPSRLRACSFNALSALMCCKKMEEGQKMWELLEDCLSGHYIPPTLKQSTTHPLPASYYMESLFEAMSPRIEETSSFIQFLTSLACLPEGPEGCVPLNDQLPFPENLGTQNRIHPGIDPYVDFSLGHIFASKSLDVQDIVQQRILRYRCLEFALTCLSTFNEDLIVFGNETNIAIDSAIQAKDLATYVTLHPFARVMEWMYDSHFITALLATIHQESSDVGSAAPDSPLILSILRGIEVLSKVLDLQSTYLDLVRPMTKPHLRSQSHSPYLPDCNKRNNYVEDGLSLNIVADLGGFCGIGHPDLTLASLKLLEKISTSSRIISAWQNGPLQPMRRNKAILALEEQGDAESIAGSFIAEIRSPLDPYLEAESPSYQTKIYILDFLYSCIRANPDRPTVAHLLLGFGCEAEALTMQPGGAFDKATSLFHTLLEEFAEWPVHQAESNMRQWLIDLKYRALRIFQILWSSPLSAGIVLRELRENDFLFCLLLQNLIVQPPSLWDDLEPVDAQFLVNPAAQGYVSYLSMKAMALEYISHELCSVSQGQMPPLKRRIIDALSGQIMVGDQVAIVPSIFEFNDFLPVGGHFAADPPELRVYKDLDLRACLEKDDDLNNTYNLDKVREMLLLKRNQIPNRNQARSSGQLIVREDMAAAKLEEENVKEEEGHVLLWLTYLTRNTQVQSYSYRVLKAWTKLLMVMTEANDSTGANRVSFILQALQAILPSLEIYGSEHPDAALELAKLAKILLFTLDFDSMAATDKKSRAIGSVVSDKLFQLFQICLEAIAKWAGTPALRAIYYSICHRYITALVDHGQGILAGLQKTTKTIQAFGERLMNVICDDACGGDAACQTAALILLGTLVNLGKNQKDSYTVETLNRLNFIAVVVDTLRDILNEWTAVHRFGNADQQYYQNAKLSLLLRLCQTRDGAKCVLHSNLFRSIELSGLFSADPELQVDSTDAKALENHYALLVEVTRIIGAAILSRGSHNVLQGRRFLTEHRMLVMFVLKRSARIGAGTGKVDIALDNKIQDLADAFMVIIMATGFLEYESETFIPEQRSTPSLFH